MQSLTQNLSFSSLLLSRNAKIAEPTKIQSKLRKGSSKNPIFFTSLECVHSPDQPISRNSSNTKIPFVSCLTVPEKVHFLACEFKSLSDPIDRVKRLLHYAALLPPFDESGRVEANRVMGCTTMVWLEAAMDSSRLMRFKVDSDSEITKGFCSCLIWLFDGAVPEEVLGVKTDDLVEMNVGMPSKGPSRVNTWHNILISMQKKTKTFLQVRDKDWSLKDYPPLVGSTDEISTNGSYKEAQLMRISKCIRGAKHMQWPLPGQIVPTTLHL
ncbi:hypothetical protein ACH5RR_035563 [Cinchona calisaya]|uniref:Fe-S metabolism associated domain-containing protein n=1 Tax=Cinchona calisaya TaxID=153742 RepID=A0ABD2Y437_9GENT